MVVAEDSAAFLQRRPEQGLGLGVAALGVVEPREVVEANERIRMVVAEDGAAFLQHRPVQGLGLGVAALGSVERREVIHERQHFRVRRRQ